MVTSLHSRVGSMLQVSSGTSILFSTKNSSHCTLVHMVAHDPLISNPTTICTYISLPSCAVSSFVLHLLSHSTLKITDEVGRDRLGSQMGEG